ncbi:MAG: hypothetical protein A2169_02270 [Deltaproteobacteria bacterium RBG_13_47_9]|nr:MAG: hypothetical protein A2169_02270 [Deltaproteobacteria bacterium RBG_13_47_9]
MNFRNMIWTILVCFIFLVTNIKAADIPPSPPARLAGYVYLNGQLLIDSNGYSLRIEIGKIEILGKIDSQGRYSLLIPNDMGIRTGGRIEIHLYQNQRIVALANIVNVPDFGTMKIVHLLY